MSLQDQINGDIKKAMLAKDQISLRGLRAIKSAIIVALTEKGSSGSLSEDQELKILQKLAKQRKDSIEIYEQQNREDLSLKEKEELDIIEGYLPQQMGMEEIEGAVKSYIEELGASGMQDMGKVMGHANKQLAGRADGKTISQIVKNLLSS